MADPHCFEKPGSNGRGCSKLWVSLDGAPDGDLFAALQKIGPDGEVVNFRYFTLQDDGQAAHGWQRISHRELASPEPGQAAPVPGQPVHPHTRELPVSPGQTADVPVEFWPSSTQFRAGETLRLLIQGTDIQAYPAGTFVAGQHRLRNRGQHALHTGEDFDAHVLLPVIPSRSRS